MYQETRLISITINELELHNLIKSFQKFHGQSCWHITFLQLSIYSSYRKGNCGWACDWDRFMFLQLSVLLVKFFLGRKHVSLVCFSLSNHPAKPLVHAHVLNTYLLSKWVNGHWEESDGLYVGEAGDSEESCGSKHKQLDWLTLTTVGIECVSHGLSHWWLCLLLQRFQDQREQSYQTCYFYSSLL